MSLAEATTARRASDFALDDLVHPTIQTRVAKLHKIEVDLKIVNNAAWSIDRHIANSSLQALAEDTGKLVWKVEQEVEALQATHNMKAGE